MEIKKIELENIRSYEKAEIEFPKGSVLLSGDIGSGKSSVLLAIEFALFGLQKGALSGNSLLRNGASSGKVKVNFDIDGKKIVIERNLKRGKKSVSQDSGYMITDNEKKDLATKEIKNYVLKLLNYPAEFLEKNPELYRYTVYTPQEEMKQILLENSETRVNTLRRVFSIDKYKRIQENSSIFLIKLRENIRNKEGMISDLEIKKKSYDERNNELANFNNELDDIMPDFIKINEIVLQKKKNLDIFESKIKMLHESKMNLASIESKIKTKSERILEIHEEKKESDISINKLKEKLGEVKIEEIPNMVKEYVENTNKKEQEIKDIRKISIEIDKKIASLDEKKSGMQRQIDNIKKLDVCPTCNQRVISQYKNIIINDIEIQFKSITHEMIKLLSEKKDIEKNLFNSEGELNKINEKKKQVDEMRIIVFSLEEKQKTMKKLDDEFRKLSEDNIDNERKKEILINEINTLKTIELDYSMAKQELDAEIDKKLEIEKKKIQTETNIKSIISFIKNLSDEINKKEEIKSQISRFVKIKDWLNEQFIPLISHIEKNVMMKLHHEFNSFFKKWFSSLSEGLTSRLDENFTPIIEQAGYDIDYSNLSGGERTAAALSYRLALNQVINSMLSHIKTRDLLILDEPTDGFSSEQLDKMGIVLSEINAKQLILVSHESKIENFVDNIIRFEKEGHVSKIA